MRAFRIVAAVALVFAALSSKAQAPSSDGLVPFVSDLHEPLVKATPEYPANAKKAHIHGLVVVVVVIGKDGSAESAAAVKGPLALRAAAVDAGMRFKWEPILINDKPIRVRTTLLFRFVLPGGSDRLVKSLR